MCGEKCGDVVIVLGLCCVICVMMRMCDDDDVYDDDDWCGVCVFVDDSGVLNVFENDDYVELMFESDEVLMFIVCGGCVLMMVMLLRVMLMMFIVVDKDVLYNMYIVSNYDGMFCVVATISGRVRVYARERAMGVFVYGECEIRLNVSVNECEFGLVVDLFLIVCVCGDGMTCVYDARS